MHGHGGGPTICGQSWAECCWVCLLSSAGFCVAVQAEGDSQQTVVLSGSRTKKITRTYNQFCQTRSAGISSISSMMNRSSSQPPCVKAQPMPNPFCVDSPATTSGTQPTKPCLNWGRPAAQYSCAATCDCRNCAVKSRGIPNIRDTRGNYNIIESTKA